MKALSVLLVALLANPGPAASWQLLLGGIDVDTTDQAVTAAIEVALQGRGWRITGRDAGVIQAGIEVRSRQCALHLARQQGRLYWSGSCLSDVSFGFGFNSDGGHALLPEAVPRRWLRYLARDIAAQLPLSANLAAPPFASATIAERLRTLKALRAEGLVSEQEYARKRREILDGL